MALDSLAAMIPEEAKDLKLNLSSLLRQAELNEQQIWGSALVAAYTCKNKTIISEVESEAKEHLDDQHIAAVKTAAALMGMNNVYYRFGHLTKNPKYSELPARLRMNGIRSHGIDSKDFELFSLVASAITGCGMCVDSHEKVLREHGVKEEQILGGVRIGSVIHGIAVALEFSTGD